MILWPQLNQLKRCPVSGLCGNGQRPSPRLPSTETPCHLAAAAGFRRAPRLSLLSLSGFFFSMRQPERNSLQSRHLPVLHGARDCHQNFKIIQVQYRDDMVQKITQKSLVTYKSQVSVMRGHTSCFVLLEVSSCVISFNRHSNLNGAFYRCYFPDELTER